MDRNLDTPTMLGIMGALLTIMVGSVFDLPVLVTTVPEVATQ